LLKAQDPGTLTLSGQGALVGSEDPLSDDYVSEPSGDAYGPFHSSPDEEGH